MFTALVVTALGTLHGAGSVSPPRRGTADLQLQASLVATRTKVVGDIRATEEAMNKELRGHTAILEEETHLLHEAEDTILRVHSVTRGHQLLQHTVASGTGTSAGKVFSDLGVAERMVEKELRGQPTVLNKELKLLRGAVSAARHAETLLQGHGVADKPVEGGSKFIGELDAAKRMVETEMRGHPKELKEEESALNRAESAVRNMDSLTASGELAKPIALADSGKKQFALVDTQNLAKVKETLETRAVQAERRYSAAEKDLANDGTKLLTEFGTVKGAVAQAFAGKDSKGVETAMEVGELLAKAREEQRHVTKIESDEAARTRKDADVRASALAQMTARNKQLQEQRQFSSGMAELAKDGKKVLAELSTAKSAVAAAFAGQDSKGVEKAMEVGELLDRARQVQQQVAAGEAKEVAGASILFSQTATK